MPKEHNKCFLCYRITPKDISNYIHIIFSDSDKNMKHKLLLQSINLITESYKKNPTYFCGKSKYSIISGLLYILGILNGCYKTQREISEQTKITEMSISKSYKLWLNLFQNLKKDYNYISKYEMAWLKEQ